MKKKELHVMDINGKVKFVIKSVSGHTVKWLSTPMFHNSFQLKWEKKLRYHLC